MSLATRCVACGTVFRVVQDQLRVSSGWVRCGRCGEVFNAIESLVDLEVDRPGDGAPPSVHGARVMEDLARLARANHDESPEASDQTTETGPGVDRPDEERPSDPELVPDLVGDQSGPPTSDGGALNIEAVALSATRDELGASPTVAVEDMQAPGSDHGSPTRPTFVREADRAARWRQPGVRATLAALVAVSAVGLVWQIHRTHHDWIAARWPALAPAVARGCELSGCELAPVRRIEALVVESSGLVRDGAADRYRLSVVLRNRERMPLHLPAVDLALTDAQGQVISRRVLGVQAFGVGVKEIAGNADVTMSTSLRVTSSSVVGYTIELFYP